MYSTNINAFTELSWNTEGLDMQWNVIPSKGFMWRLKSCRIDIRNRLEEQGCGKRKVVSTGKKMGEGNCCSSDGVQWPSKAVKENIWVINKLWVVREMLFFEHKQMLRLLNIIWLYHGTWDNKIIISF